jgi:hypothetical protein
MLTISKKKEIISKSTKVSVWLRDMHPMDNRIAQCFTCDKFVRYPEALKHHFEKPHILLPYKDTKHIDNHLNIYLANGIGEFGHIISEHNDGKATEDNLVIQCKRCNTSLGKANIELHTKDDIVMLDSSIFSNSNNSDECAFQKTEYKCSCIIDPVHNRQCNNYRIAGRDKCQTHLRL